MCFNRIIIWNIDSAHNSIYLKGKKYLKNLYFFTFEIITVLQSESVFASVILFYFELFANKLRWMLQFS